VQLEQHRPVMQQAQQQRQPMQQPSRHLPSSSVRQRPMNNAFRQLHADAQRASYSPAFAGSSQARVSSPGDVSAPVLHFSTLYLLICNTTVAHIAA
jgi:hypothetical protein